MKKSWNINWSLILSLSVIVTVHCRKLLLYINILELKDKNWKTNFPLMEIKIKLFSGIVIVSFCLTKTIKCLSEKKLLKSHHPVDYRSINLLYLFLFIHNSISGKNFAELAKRNLYKYRECKRACHSLIEFRNLNEIDFFVV